jgi:hypothetical protein
MPLDRSHDRSSFLTTPNVCSPEPVRLPLQPLAVGRPSPMKIDLKRLLPAIPILLTKDSGGGLR